MRLTEPTSVRTVPGKARHLSTLHAPGDCYGAVTQSICLAELVGLAELAEAFTALKRARRSRCIARNRLTTIRETLDRVLDDAFQRRSSAPVEHLFPREEMALEDYDEAVWQMARAQHRWTRCCSLSRMNAIS